MIYITINVKADYPISRGEAIGFIISYSNLNYESTDTVVLEDYADSTEITDEASQKIVSASIEHGLIYGYEDGTLRLNNKLTRAEFACMLYRVKDYYNPPVKQLSYEGNYSDLSDWNEKEIIYCVENGFLIGYGDVFGANDTITYEQCEIIRNRLMYGLSTREKYLLLNICGKCPIPMTEMLNSAYNAELTEHQLEFNPNEIHHYLSSPDSAKKLERTMDLIGNMDYELLQNEKYRNKLIETFRTQCYKDIYNPTQIKDNYSSTTVVDMIDFANNNHIKKESIFVFCPSNCYDMTFNFPGAYNRIFGIGYEYFRYTAADEGTLPDGVQLGLWYKRKADVNYYDYTSPSSKYAVIQINYSDLNEMCFKSLQ